MKSRVLYYSKKSNMKKLAAELAAALQTEKKEDVVPPAYSCDKEKVVFLGFTASKANDDAFARFCDGLNTTKAYNVALFVDGKEDVAKKVAERIERAGARVCPEIYYCSFKFLRSVNAVDKQQLVNWAKKIVASLES